MRSFSGFGNRSHQQLIATDGFQLAHVKEIYVDIKDNKMKRLILVLSLFSGAVLTGCQGIGGVAEPEPLKVNGNGVEITVDKVISDPDDLKHKIFIADDNRDYKNKDRFGRKGTSDMVRAEKLFFDAPSVIVLQEIVYLDTGLSLHSESYNKTKFQVQCRILRSERQSTCSARVISAETSTNWLTSSNLPEWNEPEVLERIIRSEYLQQAKRI